MCRTEPRVDLVHQGNGLRATQNIADLEKILEARIGIEGFGIISNIWEREHVCDLHGFAPDTSVDPQDGLRSQVRPVPQLRVHLPGEIETHLEDGDDQMIRRVYGESVLEPSNHAGKPEGEVVCHRVGNRPENPRDTANIDGVSLPKRGQGCRCQPRLTLLYLHLQKRAWRRLVTKVSAGTAVQKSMVLWKFGFRVKGEYKNSTPNLLAQMAKGDWFW